jgi:hypothetical protein
VCVCTCNLFPALCTSITLVICILLLYELLLIARSKNCGEEKEFRSSHRHNKVTISKISEHAAAAGARVSRRNTHRQQKQREKKTETKEYILFEVPQSCRGP